MKTSRTNEFLKELKKLFRKYGVTVSEFEDHGEDCGCFWSYYTLAGNQVYVSLGDLQEELDDIK